MNQLSLADQKADSAWMTRYSERADNSLGRKTPKLRKINPHRFVPHASHFRAFWQALPPPLFSDPTALTEALTQPIVERKAGLSGSPAASSPRTAGHGFLARQIDQMASVAWRLPAGYRAPCSSAGLQVDLYLVIGLLPRAKDRHDARFGGVQSNREEQDPRLPLRGVHALSSPARTGSR